MVCLDFRCMGLATVISDPPETPSQNSQSSIKERRKDRLGDDNRLDDNRLNESKAADEGVFL